MTSERWDERSWVISKRNRGYSNTLEEFDSLGRRDGVARMGRRPGHSGLLSIEGEVD